MSDVKRTISGEIVAEATKMRHQANEKPSKGSGKDSKLEDAKKELSMVEHQITLPELLTHMGLPADTVTDKTLLKPKGITQAFGEQRIKEEGANLLTPPPSEPEWKKFAKELFSFFACLLWLGSILCLVNYIIATDMESLYLCVVLAVVVTVTAIFSYLQNRKASKLMDSFKGMMPPRVVTIRYGVSNEMEASKLVRGDIVKLKGGDKVPADLRVLVCSDNCQVDNASLTGESEPQKRTDQFTHENPLETKNLAFFGTSVPQGSMTGMVVNTGDNTVMGRIAFLATATTAEDTPIAKEIHHFVIIVSAIAMVLGITFLIIGFAIDTPPVTNLVFMIGIIVANVPEGLLATVTVCLTLTAKRMAVKKVLVKNLEGVETLGSTTCICSDKTGTLTQNIMTVVKIIYDNKIYDTYPVPNYGEKDASFAKLQRCATLCNNAFFVEDSKTDENGKPIAFKGMKVQGDGSEIEVVQWKTNGDASESAMIKFVHSLRDIEEYRAKNPKCNDGKAEIPFNSANKYQVSVHDTPEGPVVQMKGAPERIINRCDSILIDGEVVPMTAARKAEIEARQMELSKQGLRCLGFCEKVLDKTKYPASYKYNTDNANFPLGSTLTAEDMAKDPKPNPVQAEKMCFLGITALIDPPRPAVPGAVEKCKTAGIKVIMVTGDHPITAKAIAHQVGILWGDTKEDVEEANAERGLSKGEPGWRNPEDQAFAPAIVVPGWTINEDTTEQMWDSILSHKQCVFARTSPQQKLIIVENCQRTGHIVAVTGDGVNDSPALRKADIGIAMGIMGSEVTKDAADMILLDDNFASIVKGVEEGRLIFDNLKKSIAYTLSSNIPEISPFLVFICAGVPLPLTTVLILCVDLGTDMVPAISMAYETAEADIMQRPPRNNKVDRLVTKKLVSFAYLQIGVIQACAGFYTWMVVLNDYGYPPNILPGNGDPGQWGKQPMYCQLEGGEFCNSGLDKDLRCVAAPQPYCRPVLPGHGAQMTKYASLNEDCNIAASTGPCWPCTAANPSGYFEMPTNMVDGVFNCERDNDNYIASLPDDIDKAALEAYPGVDWYKRNCFGYNSDMPKDIVGPYPFWRPGAHGDILDCAHAYPNVQPKGSDPPNYPKSYQMSTRNENEDNMNELSGNTDLPAYAFNTAQGYASLLNKGYLPYYPHRARMSPFYHQGWFWASTSDPAHIEVPSSLGKDVAAVILYNFQALNGRWVFAHTGLEFVAASEFASDGSVNTAEPSALAVTKDAADARTQFPLGSTPKWGSVVFAYNQADAGESDNNIGNLVSADARASGDSDGAGRNNYVPTTNSAASERQDIVTSGWTTTISVAQASCDTAGNTRPTVTTANNQFFKVGKQMYKQSFVTTRYYADTIGGFGGSTYTGKNTDAATSSCGGTTASPASAASCVSKTVPLFNYPFIMTYDKETTDADGATVVNADLSEPDDASDDGACTTTDDSCKYADSINKFYPLDATDDSTTCDGKNTLHHTAVNIFSRMSQKEALHHAQGAFWMCIVVVQWADLLICKTRWLSIREQGMSNQAMNFGLFFETLLAAYLAYWPVLCIAFGTREIRLVHWFTAMPFSLMIFGYDETRKYLMRATSPVTIDKGTGQSIRSPGWLERNTYY